MGYCGYSVGFSWGCWAVGAVGAVLTMYGSLFPMGWEFRDELMGNKEELVGCFVHLRANRNRSSVFNQQHMKTCRKK